MLIKNTTVEAAHPWPEGTFVQGGAQGVVFRSVERGGNYRTAFVEVVPDGGGFIRGEGATIPEAETAAWEKFQRRIACPGHEFEPRGYKNGAGFCKHCNAFSGKVFTPEDLGLSCKVCGVPTYWSRVGDDFFCPTHATDPDTLALRRRRLAATRRTDETVTGSKLGDLLTQLNADDVAPSDHQIPAAGNSDGGEQ